MNKQGEMGLRNVFFMMIIASTVLIFSGFMVLDMADTYGNTQMKNEYSGGTLNNTGFILFNNLTDSTNDIRNGTGTAIGESENVGIAKIKGIGRVIGAVFLAPISFGNLIENVLLSLAVPENICSLIGTLISITLYGIIGFVIVSALLKGGRL